MDKERTGRSSLPIFEALEPRLLLDGMTAEQGIELFHTTPAVFIENQGQWADQTVRYVHNSNGANVGITDAGPVFQVFSREAVEQSSLSGPPQIDVQAGTLTSRYRRGE